MARHRTQWEDHCKRWSLDQKGCGSAECPGARNVVLGRGQVPCDLLFIGEAPGESEDVLGYPFAGPAGKLLDHIVAEALRPWQLPGTEGGVYNAVRCAYTNLVGCVPREQPYAVDFEGTKAGGGKATEPLPEQIKQCQPRLLEFIELANPRLIIYVGALAKKWVGPLYAGNVKIPRFIPQVDLIHPAAILRANTIHKTLMVQRAVVTIQDAVEEYLQ